MVPEAQADKDAGTAYSVPQIHRTFCCAPSEELERLGGGLMNALHAPLLQKRSLLAHHACMQA